MVENTATLEQSVFAEVTKHRFDYPVSGDWLGQVVGPGIRPERSVFSLSPTEVALLRSRMRSASADTPSATVNVSESPSIIDRRFMCQVLRYCPLCIASGWHAATFQSWVVEECPVHQCKLVSVCLRCQAPIHCSLRVIARSPFSCDSCGYALARRLYGQENGFDRGPPSSAFDRLAALASPKTPASVQGALLGLQKWSIAGSEAQQAATRLRRHLVWSKAQPREAPATTETVLRFDPSLADGPVLSWRQSTKAGSLDAMDRFKQLLEMTYRTVVPRASESFPPPARRATWLPLQALLILKRLYLHHEGRFSSSPVQFSPWVDMTNQCAGAIAHAIAAAECTDLAARSIAIVAMSRLDSPERAPWQRLAAVDRLPWKVEHREGWVELHMKPRTSIAGLTRLVNRYAHTWVVTKVSKVPQVNAAASLLPGQTRLLQHELRHSRRRPRCNDAVEAR